MAVPVITFSDVLYAFIAGALTGSVGTVVCLNKAKRFLKRKSN